jgi:protein-L-isoaspartate(D-aspartate) O-methyltransferase
VFHAGCGTGYYSAIAAHTVGAGGSVVAVDIDEALIEHASEALADAPNVSLLARDATTFAPVSFDVGLVNTGLTLIPEVWLERLNPNGGRMAVPLAVPMQPTLSKAIVFLIERAGGTYAARMIGGAIIFTAVGPSNPAAQARFFESFQRDPHEVRALRRDAHAAGASCWLHEERYCLSFRTTPPGAAAS